MRWPNRYFGTMNELHSRRRAALRFMGVMRGASRHRRKPAARRWGNCFARARGLGVAVVLVGMLLAASNRHRRGDRDTMGCSACL